MDRKKIDVWNRQKGKLEEEKVLAFEALLFLYRTNRWSAFIRSLVAKNPFISHLAGIWQKSGATRKKIAPFIQDYSIDMKDFEETAYSSFNDFFIRKLKKGARAIAHAPLIAPADGRYLAYQNLKETEGVFAKGRMFSLHTFLGGDEKLTKRYEEGSMVIARLAPPDYHRFHFPVSCRPLKPHKIGGYLFSVNPVALRHNIDYLSQNKRVRIELETENLGLVTAVTIGATAVGSIHLTYTPEKSYKAGDEIGYFSFGGSMVILFFEPGRIKLDDDLLNQTKRGIETLIRMGEGISH